jgi:hypothetical protein
MGEAPAGGQKEKEIRYEKKSSVFHRFNTASDIRFCASASSKRH